MNKKLIALAVASAVVAPAAFAADGVQVYGQMNAGYEFVKADTTDGTQGNSAQTRGRVSDWTSRIGFKGSEKLSNGLTAIWQLEARVRPDDAGQGTLGSRNSYVGLAGDFGAVVLGRHDTPYKLVGAELNPLVGTTADFTGANGIFSRGEVVAGRLDNVVAYLSPNFNGFNFKVAYVTDEKQTNDVNSNKWSFSGEYEANGLKLGLGYAKAFDLGGVKDASADATKLVASYRFNGADNTAGSTLVGGGFDRVVVKNGAGTETKQSSYVLTATHNVSNELKLIANLGWLGKAKVGGSDVSETAAKQVTLGAQYALSKRTNLVGFYSKVTNDQFAAVEIGSTAGNSVGVTGGADPQVFAVGIP